LEKLQEVAMIHSNQLILVILIALSFFPVGCFSNAATPRRNIQHDPPVNVSRPDPSPAPTRPNSRQSSLSSYSDPQNDAFFHFPRNYALLEGDPQDASPDLRTQQTLAEEQPGSLLLASIIVPGDAYPNTSFISGSVQFVMNRSIAPQACRELPIARGGDVGTVTIQNTLFTWEQDASASPDSDLIERDYAGFANGACYEFFLRVRTADATADDTTSHDATPTQPDPDKILTHLENVVLSLQFPLDH
jgi:hypothetical protein